MKWRVTLSDLSTEDVTGSRMTLVEGSGDLVFWEEQPTTSFQRELKTAYSSGFWLKVVLLDEPLPGP